MIRPDASKNENMFGTEIKKKHVRGSNVPPPLHGKQANMVNQLQYSKNNKEASSSDDDGSGSESYCTDSEEETDSLEEDEDVVYKEILEACDETIAAVMNEPIKFFMPVGSNQQQFEFKPNDPIFKLCEPLLKANRKTDKCTSCRVAQVNPKEFNVCEFCANSVCKDCYTKTREFPE